MDDMIKIGKIVNAVGLKGEVKVYDYADSPEMYAAGTLYVDGEAMGVENVRAQKNTVILKLSGISDRNGAEAAKGRDIYIAERDLPELSDGEHYVKDLIGMRVVEKDGGELGKVSDVLQNTAQDIFEVECRDGRKILIPGVKQFIIDIDEKNGVITVELIEGLADL